MAATGVSLASADIATSQGVHVVVDLGGTDVLLFTAAFLDGLSLITYARVGRIETFHDDAWEFGSTVQAVPTPASHGGTAGSWRDVTAVMVTATTGVLMWVEDHGNVVTGSGYQTVHARGFTVAGLTVTFGTTIEIATDTKHIANNHARAWDLQRISDTQVRIFWQVDGIGHGTTLLSFGGGNVSDGTDVVLAASSDIAVSNAHFLDLGDGNGVGTYQRASDINEHRVVHFDLATGATHSTNSFVTTTNSYDHAVGQVAGRWFLLYSIGTSSTAATRMRELTIAGSSLTLGAESADLDGPTGQALGVHDLDDGLVTVITRTQNLYLTRYVVDPDTLTVDTDVSYPYSQQMQISGNAGFDTYVLRGYDPDGAAKDPYSWVWFGSHNSVGLLWGMAIIVAESGPATVCHWQPEGGGSITAEPRFVAVGSRGARSVSDDDGATWDGFLAGSLIFRAVRYGTNLWIAVGENAIIYRSLDGVGWDSISSGYSAISGNSFYGIDYDPDAQRWVIGMAGGRLLYSVNRQGSSWTTVTLSGHTTKSLHGVHRGADKWVAGGSAGLLVTSPDGATWTVTASHPLGANDQVRGIVYSYDHGLWVAVTLNNTTAGPGKIITSPDGVNWTLRATFVTAGSAAGFTRVAYGGGRFVAVGIDDLGIVTSTDGVTWTVADATRPATGVAYGPDGWVAVGENVAYFSDDGLTWSTSPHNFNEGGANPALLDVGAGVVVTEVPSYRCDEFYLRNSKPAVRSKFMGQTGTTGPMLGALDSAFLYEGEYFYYGEGAWAPVHDCFDATTAVISYATYDSDEESWDQARFAVLVHRGGDDGNDLGWTSRIRITEPGELEKTDDFTDYIFGDLICLNDAYAVVAWWEEDLVGFTEAVAKVALLKREGDTLSVVSGPTAVQLGYDHGSPGYEGSGEGFGLYLTKVDDTRCLLSYDVDQYHEQHWGWPAIRILERAGDTLTVHAENVFPLDRDVSAGPSDQCWTTTVPLGQRSDGRWYFQLAFQSMTYDNWWARYVAAASFADDDLDSITFYPETRLVRSTDDYVNPPLGGVALDGERAVWCVGSETTETCVDSYRENDIANTFGYGTTIICATTAPGGVTSVGSELLLDGAFDTGDVLFGSYNPQPWHPYVTLVKNKLVVQWNRDVRPPKYPIEGVDVNSFASEVVNMTITPTAGDVCDWQVCGGFADLWLNSFGYYQMWPDNRPRAWPGTDKYLHVYGRGSGWSSIEDPPDHAYSDDNYDWSGWGVTPDDQEDFYGIFAFAVTPGCIESCPPRGPMIVEPQSAIRVVRQWISASVRVKNPGRAVMSPRSRCRDCPPATLGRAELRVTREAGRTR